MTTGSSFSVSIPSEQGTKLVSSSLRKGNRPPFGDFKLRCPCKCCREPFTPRWSSMRQVGHRCTSVDKSMPLGRRLLHATALFAEQCTLTDSAEPRKSCTAGQSCSSAQPVCLESRPPFAATNTPSVVLSNHIVEVWHAAPASPLWPCNCCPEPYREDLVLSRTVLPGACGHPLLSAVSK